MSVTYIDAIREAQAKLLREDPRVFLYGQDIATFGGAFKATKGLAEEFPGRVYDAPISEDAMIGLAVGAAIEGMRPIVEMQFADFSSVAFNQIVNQAATHFYRTGVPVPLSTGVRLALDAGRGRRAVPVRATIAGAAVAIAAVLASAGFGASLDRLRARLPSRCGTARAGRP